jgi:hypothetical protein
VPGRRIILVDTNIIIECVRAGCWKAIVGHYQVESVKKCCEEARTGDGRRPGYVTVKDEHLLSVTQNAVHPRERAALSLAYPEADRLDAGERDLWAHALTRRDEWSAVSADHAAVNAACYLGWKDRLESLEAFVRAAGSTVYLKEQFTSRRLTQWRTEFLLASAKP